MAKNSSKDFFEEMNDEVKSVDGGEAAKSDNIMSEDDVKQASDLSEQFRKFLQAEKDTIDQHNVDTKTVIPTGINILDAMAGGGIATNFVQFVGNPGSGKSMLASRILAECQRQYRGKFLGIYIDTENSASKDRLAQLGVNGSCTIYNKRITVEKVLKSIETICAFKDNNPAMADVPSVVIWDSIANTLTEKGIEADDINSVLGEKARIFSAQLPKISDYIAEYNVALIAINQLRDKLDIGPVRSIADLKFLNDKQIPGGKSILFNSFQLFYIKPIGDIKGEYGFTGCKVEIRSVKNKLFSPNIRIPLIYSFERGFSNFWSNYEMLKENKRISSGGGWCKLVDYESSKKFRQSDAITIYQEDPKFKECFDEHVKEVIDLEIINKYKSTDFSKVEAF